MTEQRSDASYFRDWEAECFGYGYGTGESHIMGALCAFLRKVPANGPYDYEVLEREVGSVVAWLLINALCRINAIEYGTSPRYGWLTRGGNRLRDYVLSMSFDDLMGVLESREEDQPGCGLQFCNCGPQGYDAKRVCPNPFWSR